MLAALGGTAALLRLSAADALMKALAVSVPDWLAWAVPHYALTQPRGARGKGQEKAADEVARPPPEFIDTQATWKSPGQESVDVAI